MRRLILALTAGALLIGIVAGPAAAKSVVPGKPGPQTIYDIAASNPDFSTLKTLLDLTGLDAAVKQTDSKLTVFAPTNAAFAKLPSSTVDFLLSPAGRDTLVDILLYHVTDGRRFSNSVFGKNDKTIEMLNGGMITTHPNLTITDGQGQTITPVLANVNASNGVIHAIDTVLLP
jgi:uncharacterized surface protein with fasciclin (FAS1) repeats